MLIKSFGLFWRRDEVEWNPGKGRPFRLLGHQGENLPGVRLSNFREQKGIYILYGNHGAAYVGLTENALGIRLKEHLSDGHAHEWDRFSWFGFRAVLEGKENGFCRLKEMAKIAIGSPSSVITDVEALLIRAMGLSNINQMRFTEADEWKQVNLDEIEKFTNKVG